MRHGEDSAPVLDAGSGAEPGEPLGHLQREHVACPFLECEVHLVKASTLGGIIALLTVSKKWTCDLSMTRIASWRHILETHVNRFALILQVHGTKSLDDLA